MYSSKSNHLERRVAATKENSSEHGSATCATRQRVDSVVTPKQISINEQSTLVFANKRNEFPLCDNFPWIKLLGILECARPIQNKWPCQGLLWSSKWHEIFDEVTGCSNSIHRRLVASHVLFVWESRPISLSFFPRITSYFRITVNANTIEDT